MQLLKGSCQVLSKNKLLWDLSHAANVAQSTSVLVFSPKIYIFYLPRKKNK
jgi:hypothetical protein